jgi:hypothetical protein
MKHSLFVFVLAGLASVHAQCPSSFEFTGRCNIAAVSEAADCDLRAALGGISESELEALVEDTCAGAVASNTRNFTDITLNGKNDKTFQWDNNYFDGGTSWNDEKETATESLYTGDLGSVLRAFNDYASNSIISWPNYHPETNYIDNFKDCDLRMAMCCFIDSRLDSPPFIPNADICNHDLHDSKHSNHINRGHAVFESRRDKAYCNAFSWSSDTNEMSSRYAGNALFYISMYSGLYENGYVENIPSSPMCGCIEQMATVDASDCTKVDAVEKYTFSLENSQLSATLESEVSYSRCDTQIVSHYKSMANEKEVEELVSHHIVDDCFDANVDFINSMFYVPGSSPELVDTSKWAIVVGEGEMYHPPIGDTAFRALIGESSNQIIYRKCLQCDNIYQNIYYKRLTSLPPAEEHEFLDLFMSNWYESPSNKLGVDFNLFSTYEDALAGTNAWVFCSYDEEGIGFPGNCGVSEENTRKNWNSYAPTRTGGRANDHAFYVERNIDSSLA